MTQGRNSGRGRLVAEKRYAGSAAGKPKKPRKAATKPARKKGSWLFGRRKSRPPRRRGPLGWILWPFAVLLRVVWAISWRMGVIVAVLLPLVTLTAIALYALGGGVLQQMAVIGLVVALGILVDNAIVMTENVQWHLNGGAKPHDAAMRSVRR